jgi:hypothetical protein
LPFKLTVFTRKLSVRVLLLTPPCLANGTLFGL